MTAGFADRRAEKIAREAADWHARLLEPVSVEERARFDLWHAEPDHARAYAELSGISALAQQLPRPARRPRAQPKERLALRPALAFTLLGLILVAGLIFAAARGGEPAQAALVNDGPATRMVRLEDGTMVTLEPGTHLRIALGSSRAATLMLGRARFDVPPDRAPFTIDAGPARLVLAGGTLDAALGSNGLDAVLLHGSATAMAAPDTGIIALAEREAVTIQDGKVRPARTRDSDLEWPLARLAFDKAPLGAIVARANAAGGKPLRLAPGTEALSVTGVLDLRDTRALATKLAAALDLQSDERRDAILLSK